MQSTIYSYRFAEEIIQHTNYISALNEISNVIDDCPLYLFPNKSSTNRKLDVVQQLLNAYFDRRFITDLGWDDHPQATKIPSSDLKADYKKDFHEIE